MAVIRAVRPLCLLAVALIAGCKSDLERARGITGLSIPADAVVSVDDEPDGSFSMIVRLTPEAYDAIAAEAVTKGFNPLELRDTLYIGVPLGPEGLKFNTPGDSPVNAVGVRLDHRAHRVLVRHTSR